MTSPIQQHLDALIDFVTEQMDGAQVPPAGSAGLTRLGAAVAAIQTSASDRDLQMLGLRTMSAVIARACSSIAAEKALRDFIRPGGQL